MQINRNVKGVSSSTPAADTSREETFKMPHIIIRRILEFMLNNILSCCKKKSQTTNDDKAA